MNEALNEANEVDAESIYAVEKGVDAAGKSDREEILVAGKVLADLAGKEVGGTLEDVDAAEAEVDADGEEVDKEEVDATDVNDATEGKVNPL